MSCINPLQGSDVIPELPLSWVAPPELRVTLQGRGSWTVVTITGEMDGRLGSVLADLAAVDAHDIVLDLEGVTFVDAAGLGAMVASRHRSILAGSCVRLVSPSAVVRRAMLLTDTGPLFLTFESVDSALAVRTAALNSSAA